MSDHYIEIKTVNAKMKRMYGDKFTWTQAGIEKRSNGLHVELRFSTRYGQISFSCTLADGVGGCRFKMIGYSHGYRWSTVRIAVTAEQEARLFAKACELADVENLRGIKTSWIDESDKEDLATRLHVNQIKPKEIFYGPNHIKYDKWGASFGFISKLRIWRMHPDDMICNEACANVLLEVWPDLLDIKKEDGFITMSMELDSEGWAAPTRVYPKKDPATLTPDQFHYLAEHYFEQKGQVI